MESCFVSSAAETASPQIWVQGAQPMQETRLQQFAGPQSACGVKGDPKPRGSTAEQLPAANNSKAQTAITPSFEENDSELCFASKTRTATQILPLAYWKALA